MHRTQIHLDDRQIRALDRAGRETGASRSELIRRAIDIVYDGRSTQRWPRSIGSVSVGIDASRDEEILAQDWGPRRRRRSA
jgi:metal-responsive CopG/Arc/MetJ family transcriptional regulator